MFDFASTAFVAFLTFLILGATFSFLAAIIYVAKDKK